jgi:Listeria-Bacteroides repeat domain (List_Bact_rpt)
MKVLTRILIFTLFAQFYMFAPTAHAVNFTITYIANETQHQTGVTSGSVPSTTTHASGAVVTVAANSGNLARQGFTFAGWNTAANGSGTNYSAGIGSFTISANTTLHAKWEIPAAARLIGAGGSIINFTNTNNVTNGNYCTASNVRGITSDGTFLYFRPSLYVGHICKMSMSGNTVSVSSNISTLASIASDSLALTYSAGCIFIRDTGATGNRNIYCIDVSDWTITLRNLPNNLYAGSSWLFGNLIDFPDGRIGAVSAPNTAVASPGTGTCPVGMFCKVLRLFNVVGTGKAITFTFSEDILLADTVNNWPLDDHGIATDGTYLYQIYHANGYKVWALRSGAPAYLAFNADGTGNCGATTGISGTRCSITFPVSGNSAEGSMTNTTYIGRNHVTGNLFIGDYDNKRFYLSPAGFPPAGPGSLIAAINSLSLPSSATTASFRTPVTVSVSVSVASRVTFRAGNVVISGCKNKSASGSGSVFTATCTWRPSVRGAVPLTVVATPTGPAYASATSNPLNIFVGRRTGSR